MTLSASDHLIRAGTDTLNIQHCRRIVSGHVLSNLIKVALEDSMATPGWIRKRWQREAAETRIARAELHLQSLERIEKEEAEAKETWTPRQGMSFASEG